MIFIHYMVNVEFVWKLRLEKPRFLFSLVGIGFMHLMLYGHNFLSSENFLLQSIMVATFGLAFFLSQIPWTKRFEKNFITKKSPPQPGSTSFEFKISDLQIQQLYNELIRYDLLCSDKTCFEAFRNVMTKNWDCHNSKIYLNLDGPSCREFYDHLVKTFPSNSSTLKNFFETSGLIVRANGKPYKYNTVKNAPTRTPVSKHHEALKDIFFKLK